MSSERFEDRPAPEGASAKDVDDASVGNEEEDASVGSEDGEASGGSEGTGASGGGAPGQAAPLVLLAPAAPSAFLSAARGLVGSTAGSTVLVIDVQGSSGGVLRASAPGSGGGGSFDIPAAAVETVTPLGVHGGNPRWLLASVSFRAGFESLATIFGRLGGGERVESEEGATFAALPGEAFTGGPDDDDPAAPGAAEVSEVADLSTARTLANVGMGVGATEAFEFEGPRPETDTATPPTMPLDVARMRAFLNACTGSNPRVTYGLGAKVPFHGAVPGKDFKKIDCSGFVREAIRLATNPAIPFPDGSVVQHEFVRNKKFRKSNVEAAFKTDGAVRIAFLRPQDVKSGIGHVVLIHNAMTLESHGGTGPNSRPWNGAGWQAKAFVYRLTDPPA